jgi:hypothetical protein
MGMVTKQPARGVSSPWKLSASLSLLQNYPWFLPIWRQYEEIVMRGDALRYFIMDHFGGLYLDLDVECFRYGGELLPELAHLAAAALAATPGVAWSSI